MRAYHNQSCSITPFFSTLARTQSWWNIKLEIHKPKSRRKKEEASDHRTHRDKHVELHPQAHVHNTTLQNTTEDQGTKASNDQSPINDGKNLSINKRTERMGVLYMKKERTNPIDHQSTHHFQWGLLEDV